MNAPAAVIQKSRSRLRAVVATVPLSTVGAGVVVVLILVAAVAPQFLATDSAYSVDLGQTLAPPSSQHWFGTDSVGRDLYSRIIWGTRSSLLIGLGAMALSLLIGLLLGFVAALTPRWLAGPTNRLLDILLAFPVLLLSLLFVALLGPSEASLIIAVGIGSAPGYARLIRAQALGVRDSAYVEAAQALGHDRRTIFTQHIFPNSFRPLVALVALGVGQSIVWASGLSFLGLGVAPPSPEWGALLNSGRADITTAWWLEVMPGIAIVFTALAFTQVGRYFQDRSEGITH
ncbi:ABC transporter permease [Gordonia sp. NB41Y]|uniref:ABC transporter permease n=1 Tax=Gordonia sp. NB41Y TaxID=875808 RepID=UPI0006B210E6|nr:ABC transporter permease [Gordonia sp. NB41Y]EMP14761.2 peptide ABC transporter permease [Gordonia sp. NB41Y]WLP92115.1 ABC transporter permease [Gordonia sp. NB41Y]